MLGTLNHHSSRRSFSLSVVMVAPKAQKTGSKQPAPISTRAPGPARPEVIVEFLFDRGLLHIAVNNIGDRPALNVSVKFDKKILGLNGRKEISALAMFKNIEFLGPRREIVCLLDSSSSYFKRKQPTKISALVAYRDLEKRSYEVTIKHDLEIYRELAFIVPVQSHEEN
jgi:hypothetical protein